MMKSGSYLNYKQSKIQLEDPEDKIASDSNNISDDIVKPDDRDPLDDFEYSVMLLLILSRVCVISESISKMIRILSRLMVAIKEKLIVWKVSW